MYIYIYIFLYICIFFISALYSFIKEEITVFETSYHFLEVDDRYISYHGNKEIKQEQH